jgi:Zn-dependent peptidase ImmA (M78 family)
VDVLVENGYQRVPEHERFADAFSFYFTMPTSGLKRQVTTLLRGKDRLSVANLLNLADYFTVSVEAMTRRLEEMGVVSRGTWDKIKSSDLKIRDAQKQLGIKIEYPEPEKLPKRYQLLALQALEEEQITEGQFAALLQTDVVNARQIREILQGELEIDPDTITNPDA